MRREEAAPVQVTTRTFTLPKAGNAPEENEDTARPLAAPQSVALDPQGTPFRAAIADGAAQTAFAGLWANLLADGWQNGVIAPDDFLLGVSRCAAAWRARVARDFDALPWFVQEKARAGAGAALLGVAVSVATEEGGKSATWRALSLGDCGLFHVRGNDLIASFPFARSDDYNSTPILATTDESARERLSEVAQIRTGNVQAGDTLFLATDALAAWFLSEREANRAPTSWLRGLRAEGDSGAATGGVSFARFAGEQRALGRLQNDDTTLVIAEFQGSSDERRGG